MEKKAKWGWDKAKTCQRILLWKGYCLRSTWDERFHDHVGKWQKVVPGKVLFYTYLREAHSIFKAKHPHVTISYPAFWKMKPWNALLLKSTPLDKCRCETREKKFFKLTALNIDYHNNFWEDCLRQGNSEDIAFLLHRYMFVMLQRAKDFAFQFWYEQWMMMNKTDAS